MSSVYLATQGLGLSDLLSMRLLRNHLVATAGSQAEVHPRPQGKIGGGGGLGVEELLLYPLYFISDFFFQKQRERTIHLLVHSLNGYNCWGWARTKPGARNPISISHMSGRDWNLLFLQVQMGSRAAGTCINTLLGDTNFISINLARCTSH